MFFYQKVHIKLLLHNRINIGCTIYLDVIVNYLFIRCFHVFDTLELEVFINKLFFEELKAGVL